jgi:hypothetical protein
MRSPRFRLRTLMVSIAFLGLLLTLAAQAIWLRSAELLVRQLRARLARVDPEAAWAQEIEDSHRFWSSPQNQRRWAAQMDYKPHRLSPQHAPH